MLSSMRQHNSKQAWLVLCLRCGSPMIYLEPPRSGLAKRQNTLVCNVVVDPRRKNRMIELLRTIEELSDSNIITDIIA